MKELIKNILYDTGKLLMSEFTKSNFLEFKKLNDKIDFNQILTEQDILINNFICEEIKKSYPKHSIISEEKKTNSLLTDNPTWVIDPIDGTMNFHKGLPFFCISIAYWENKEAIYSGVFAPFLNELFYAEKGKGALLNGKPLKVSRNNILNESVILMSGYSSFEKNNRELAYIKLSKSIKNMRILSSSILDMCYVAAGRCEARVYASCKFWDIAASKLILEEAGGKITNWNNRVDNFSSQIIASNTVLHNKLLKIIND